MDSAFAATGEKPARFLKKSGMNFTVMPDPKPEIRSATNISRAMPSSPASSSSSSSHASAPTSRNPSKRSAGGAHSASPTTATVFKAARDQSSPMHRKSTSASAGPAVVANRVRPNFRAVASAPVWKSNFRRPTPSKRRCPRNCGSSRRGHNLAHWLIPHSSERCAPRAVESAKSVSRAVLQQPWYAPKAARPTVT